MAENKVLLSIAGLNLLVTTPEEEEYVQQIAQEIDENVTAILDKSTGASVTSAVLLCAIDYLDSAKKASKSATNMRTQIKEYMAEAANAKMLFDNETKKTAELAAEIQALRNHLTRIATEGDTSGILNKLKEEYNASSEEIVRLRNANSNLTTQNKSLSEKSEAMNSYISGQDREIARLTAVTDELSSRLNSKTNIMAEMSEKLSASDIQITELTKENIRLANELSLLEQMIGEEPNDAPAAAVAEPAPVLEPEPAALFAEPEAAAPPVFFSPAHEEENFNRYPVADTIVTDAPVEPESVEIPAPVEEPAPEPAPEPTHSYLPPLEPKKYELPPRNRPIIDIDLSDLPDRAEPKKAEPEAPVKEGDDAFKEYQIAEDDTVLGFRSVMNDKEYAEQEAARVVLESLTAENIHNVIQTSTESFFEEVPVEIPTETPNDDPPFEMSGIKPPISDEPEFLEPIPETRKSAKPRGKLEDIIENLDDDGDEMPNLSWTLDI